MYLRSDDGRPQMRNGLALRITVVVGVAVALFAVLFFRLWDLQVLSGEKYREEANNNRTREFRVEAPRGEILDSSGRAIVDNRTSLALQVNPQKLPLLPARRRAELARLGALAHMSPRQVRRTMHEQLAVAGGAPVTLRRNVGYDLVYYLQENQDRFPGVQVQRVFVRNYPHGTLAAHVLGIVGEINEEELKEARYRHLQPGDEIGKGGVEQTYDRYLRGKPGLTRIQVNALGEPTPGGQLVSKPPVPGDNLKLSLESKRAGSGGTGARRRGPAGRVSDDERAQRPDPRPRLLSRPTNRASSPSRTDPGPGQLALQQPARRRSPTAPPKGSIPPARPSSRSPRWRR